MVNQPIMENEALDIPGNSESLSTPNEALNILGSSESLAYVPKGHTFTIYTAEDLISTYSVVIGGAIVAFAIIWLLMRVLGGERYE